MVSGTVGRPAFHTGACASRLNSAVMLVVALAAIGVDVGSTSFCSVLLVGVPSVAVG